jgi:hypothetical protein
MPPLPPIKRGIFNTLSVSDRFSSEKYATLTITAYLIFRSLDAHYLIEDKHKYKKADNTHEDFKKPTRV